MTAGYTPTGTTFAASASAAQTITVTPGNLAVSATSVTRGYGQTNPALTYTISGYVNGESAATATSGAPVETTTAAAMPVAGAYPITITQGNGCAELHAGVRQWDADHHAGQADDYGGGESDDGVCGIGCGADGDDRYDGGNADCTGYVLLPERRRWKRDGEWDDGDIEYDCAGDGD